MEQKDIIVKHQRKDNSEILKRRSERQNVEISQRQTLKDITAGFNTRTRCDVSSRTVCRRVFQNEYKHRVISCEPIASHTVFHSVLYQLTKKSGDVKSNIVLPSIHKLLMTSIAS